MIVSALFAVILMLCLVLAMLTFYLRGDDLTPSPEAPLVSILVAARDEEENIVRCLEALDRLTYPRYEVWIGDDQSTDKTVALVEAFIADKPHFQLVRITHTVGQAKGKSNVLAQLAAKAKGEYFFVTDADIAVPQRWVEYMLGAFGSNTGVVSGFTLTESSHWMGAMQRIDWAYAMGMVKVVSDWQPIVAVGNNMAVTREAYYATGGYEKLPFSVVEDYQLFTEITSKGYSHRNVLHPEVLAISKPIATPVELLKQRKRWMYGAFQLPIWVLGILILQASYYGLVIALLFLAPVTAMNLAVLKWFLQTIFIKQVFKKLQQPISIMKLVQFELYQVCLSTLSLVWYVLPSGIRWKGRRY